MDRTSPPTSSESPRAGFVPRGLSALVGVVASYPRVTLFFAAVLIAAAVGVTATGLKFKTSRADLIDPAADFHQRWTRYVERFGDQNDIVVVVEGDRPAIIRSVLDELGARIEADDRHFRNTLYRIDPSSLRSKGLQYLSPQALEGLASHLEVYSPVLEGNWKRAGLELYIQNLSHFLRRADRAGRTDDVENLLGQCQLLANSLDLFFRNPGDAASFVSPWPQLVEGADRVAGLDLSVRYLMNRKETMGFLVTMPAIVNQDFSGGSASIRRLRELVDAVEREHESAGIRIGLTGIPILESDEMSRSQMDMSWATLLSFAVVAVLLLIGFRGLRHPMLAMLMLLAGIAWAIGFTTLAIGHLTILTISFAAILAGLGIDFAIHFLSRYLALRHEGKDLMAALRGTAGAIGTGILTCAATTALAFGAASFTSFLGVAELGVISGAGIVCCALAVFFVLPPLIALADRKRAATNLPRPLKARALRWVTREIPWPLTLTGLCVAIGCLGAAFDWTGGRPKLRVRYDGNLLHMQARGVESVELQDRLFRESDSSLLYAVSLASNPAEARRQKERLRALPSVARVEEIVAFLPEYPASETQLLVQAIHARLSRLAPLPAPLANLNPGDIGDQQLDKLYTALSSRSEPAAKQAAASLDRFLDTLAALPVEHQSLLINAYQQAMLQALHGQFEQLLAISNPDPVSANELPEGLRSRFLSPEGDWLLRIFPREQVWDEAALAQFVTEVRSVDPEATGTPLQNYEAALQIRDSYLHAGLYALAVVLGALLIDFLRPIPRLLALASPLLVIGFAFWIRRSGPSILDQPAVAAVVALAVAVGVSAVFDFRNLALCGAALLPPVLGGGMLLGLMALLQIDFNPANMIVVPLILGIGVDYGVVLVHEYRATEGPFCVAGSTVSALLLTSTTTMAGFGSMLIAAHQGLVSLGLVLLLGIVCVLFVALVPVSALLTGFSLARRPSSRDAPVRIGLPSPRTASASDGFSAPLAAPHFRDRSGPASASSAAVTAEG